MSERPPDKVSENSSRQITKPGRPPTALSSRPEGRRQPDLDTVYSINQDGSRNMLHPADVQGRWQVRKDVIFAVLIVIYAALPWIQIGGRPLVHFDLPGRAADLFGQSFSNQDFYLVFFLVSGVGFALFVLTSLWGRLWCGFACPQTVFMEGVFRRIERWLEGPRLTRIRRNRASWNFDKVWRKTVKQGLFLVLSFLIAHVFLSYFLPARELFEALRSSPRDHLSAFLWTIFWTVVLYFNYAWFREQTCLIVCPYGRLQSTLIDPETIIIGYDCQRGEPRMKGVDQGGDCIDCLRCVHVCPTGIDIRNGLQMECIGCANCIDACDAIMDRLGKPRGLVRFDSQSGFETGRRRFLRARFWIYLGLGLAGMVAFLLTATERVPFEAKAVRSRGLPFVLEENRIRNLYTLHIQNKEASPNSFRITPMSAQSALPDALEYIIPQEQVHLEGLASLQVPLFAILPRQDFAAPFAFRITVTDSVGGRSRTVAFQFRGP